MTKERMTLSPEENTRENYDRDFDKALDEELTGEAIYKSGWVDE